MQEDFTKKPILNSIKRCIEDLNKIEIQIEIEIENNTDKINKLEILSNLYYIESKLKYLLDKNKEGKND